MSNTRRTTDESAFHQERFASSESYAKPLLGNLVAKRAKAIADPDDRALVYFLQQLSHKDGGLEKVARDLLGMFPERIGTPAMHEIGETKNGLYSSEQVKAIRNEIPGGRRAFPLEGDYFADGADDDEVLSRMERAKSHPSSYPVAILKERCENSFPELADHLRSLCLNPEVDLKSKKTGFLGNCWSSQQPDGLAGLWWFQDLIETLHEYRNRQIAQAANGIASTAISRKVYEDLKYALETRSLVIVEGLERMGKSVTARNFCDRHPGQAIYIRLESGGDDMTLYRTIAKAIGTATATRKAAEIKHRIEDMLQESHLMLVIDEAHFLFPQAARVQRGPSRIDWLRTALVDFQVPVALISTPQFDRQCERFEKLIGWNARQIKGRVALHTVLPTELEPEDLEAIAKHLLPEADKQTITRLRGFAEATDDYVAGIERIVKRARWFAQRKGEETASADDVRKAVNEVIPPAKLPISGAEIREKNESPAPNLNTDLNRFSEPVKNRLKPSVSQKSEGGFSRESTFTTAQT